MIALGQVSPDAAFTVLREISQRTNLRLCQVAQLITGFALTGALPADIRKELWHRLHTDRGGPDPGP